VQAGVPWGAVHARPQAPQLVRVVVRSDSQPLAASPSQSPKPLAQSQRGLGEVRGHGLLLGVEVIDEQARPAPQRAKRIINGLRERGVLIGGEGPAGNVLKLRPPMCFGPEHAQRVTDTLREVLADPRLAG